MKITTLRLLLPCLFMAFSGAAHSVILTASANLDYAQEVTPSNSTPSPATGIATLVFDTATGSLDLSATITGISLSDVTFPSGGLAFGAAGPFHIHQGAAGMNGDIVVPFNSESFFTETVDGLAISATAVGFDTALVTPLLDGDLYLNLHSLDYGSGEIRGQLSVPEPGTMALLGSGLLGLAVIRRRRLR